MAASIADFGGGGIVKWCCCVAAAALIVIFSLPNGCGAIWLNLPKSGTKCVSEDLHNNVVVLADYTVMADEHSHDYPTISAKLFSGGIDVNPLGNTFCTHNGLQVTSPFGNTLHHQENVTHGQFAFTASEAGNYLACFGLDTHHQGKEASVNVDWKTGIAARDWESVAKKEKIEGVELELRKLEGVVEAIHDNLLYLKVREAEMRTVSETTNGRVAWFSIMSLGVCIVVSALQLWHLKGFFQKKKLI